MGGLPVVYEEPPPRAQCKDGPRPCKYLACRYHLATNVNRSGSISVINGLQESCSLDIAEKGSHTLEEVGSFLGITRERVRQIEKAALSKLKEIQVFEETRYDNA